MITKLIRLAERLKRGINYSRKRRYVFDKETEADEVQRRELPCSLPDPPIPLPSLPIRTPDYDLIQPETEDSAHTRKIASPPTTVRPQISTSSIKGTAPVTAVVDQASPTHLDSSSVIHIPSGPSSTISSSWNTRETDLTGSVRVYQLHRVYDGPYSTVYRGIYGGGYVAVKVVKPVGPPHSIRRVRELGVKTQSLNLIIEASS